MPRARWPLGDLPGMLTDVLGREIEYLQVPPAAARKTMLDKGAPEWLADEMALVIVRTACPSSSSKTRGGVLRG